ncbi:MAG: hypothetical protein HOE90_11820 [Bacteriovoracaceae bacterium]|nr:hypothetical protein [Bacteriovoracaceae bacterium]
MSFLKRKSTVGLIVSQGLILTLGASLLIGSVWNIDLATGLILLAGAQVFSYSINRMLDVEQKLLSLLQFTLLLLLSSSQIFLHSLLLYEGVLIFLLYGALGSAASSNLSILRRYAFFQGLLIFLGTIVQFYMQEKISSGASLSQSESGANALSYLMLFCPLWILGIGVERVFSNTRGIIQVHILSTIVFLQLILLGKVNIESLYFYSHEIFWAIPFLLMVIFSFSRIFLGLNSFYSGVRIFVALIVLSYIFSPLKMRVEIMSYLPFWVITYSMATIFLEEIWHQQLFGPWRGKLKLCVLVVLVGLPITPFFNIVKLSFYFTKIDAIRPLGVCVLTGWIIVVLGLGLESIYGVYADDKEMRV